MSFRGIFSQGKADDDGGLTPSEEDNADMREKNRKNWNISVWKQDK